jgi:acetoin utilization deacetylase AcuC-like enzyme
LGRSTLSFSLENEHRRAIDASNEMDTQSISKVQSERMSLPLVYHPDFVAPLPPQHRFPMPKFGRVYQTLIREGIASPDQFHVPEQASPRVLELVHDPAYIRSFLTGSIEPHAMRRIGLPWSDSLVVRTCTAVGGTLLTAQLAMQHGLACSTAGGTHHAHADFGSGYCIFNDLAIAARHIIRDGKAQRVLIVDLDVHQGDGTASIFRGDSSVFTYSVHCGTNFPFRKQAGDLDIDLPAGTDDRTYLDCLHHHLPRLLAEIAPDLVLYDAGVDPHIEDRLGKLALTSPGLFARDYYVISTCLSAGVPIACVIGGGYDRNTDRLAQRHCLLHRAADEVFSEFGL